ncbi:MAG: hypothetical protein ACFFA3_19580 [Promethearchaeota archaeon]
MKKKTDLTYFFGIILFSFGIISISYSVSALVFRISIGFTGSIMYVKDIGFDLVFLLLGFLIIRKVKIPNPPKHRLNE